MYCVKRSGFFISAIYSRIIIVKFTERYINMDKFKQATDEPLTTLEEVAPEA